MIRLKAKGIRSLLFEGDCLTDWVGGGTRYALDGSKQNRKFNYSYRFDGVGSCSSMSYVVIYERLGTKGVLLDREGQFIREINRSYYCANSYEYPIALWDAPDGRHLMAHCPDSYCQIEIDDVTTGERITTARSRSPGDYFHSRLQVNDSATHLLTAGWVWHPWDFVGWFDLNAAIRDGKNLDQPMTRGSSLSVGLAEEASGCWQSDRTILIGSSDEPEDPDEIVELGNEVRLHPRGLVSYDINGKAITASVALEHPPGMMMPVGMHHVVTFYGHPRLYSLADGSIIDEWPDLHTGNQTSSICGHLPDPVPIAFDPEGRRFAVGLEDNIAVVSLQGRF